MKKIMAPGFLFATLVSCSLSHADEFDVSKFTDLRMSYAQSSSYDPSWDRDENRKQIIELFKAGKNDDGLRLARDWLSKFPFDAELHLFCSLVLHDVGRYKESLMHRYIHHGLLASIISSGDGESLDNPFKVISVGEEYFLLRALGARLTKQALIRSENGIPLDKMDCEIDGKEVVFYFDVSISMNAIDRMLNKE